MPDLSEMTPDQRRLYDHWRDMGEPNPNLLAIRSAKATVRRQLGRGIDPEVIRAVVLDRAGRACDRNGVDEAGHAAFLEMIRRAVEEALAETL